MYRFQIEKYDNLEADPISLYKFLEIYAFPRTMKEEIDIHSFFAFSYKSVPSKVNGWNIYSLIKEYTRMGIDFNSEVL